MAKDSRVSPAWLVSGEEHLRALIHVYTTLIIFSRAHTVKRYTVKISGKVRVSLMPTSRQRLSRYRTTIAQPPISHNREINQSYRGKKRRRSKSREKNQTKEINEREKERKKGEEKQGSGKKISKTRRTEKVLLELKPTLRNYLLLRTYWLMALTT